MNLIEQLGGYEAAKAHVLEIVSDYDGVTDKTKLYDFQFNIGQVKQALLEYRREHNIFEVGDYVCYRGNGGLDAIFQVETLTPKTKKPKTLRCGRWGNYSVGNSLVNHATDEEIMKGRKL